MLKCIFGLVAFLWACVCGVYAGDELTQVKSKALAHYIMATTYDLNARPVEAITKYEKAAKLDPSQPMPHLRLAAYYARTGLFGSTTAGWRSKP